MLIYCDRVVNVMRLGYAVRVLRKFLCVQRTTLTLRGEVWLRDTRSTYYEDVRNDYGRAMLAGLL